MTDQVQLGELLVDQSDVDLWATISGADSRLHLDPEWATPRYGGTIVPAILIACKALALIDIKVPAGASTHRPALVRTKIRSAVHPGQRIQVWVNPPGDGQTREAIDYRCVTAEGVAVIEGSIRFGAQEVRRGAGTSA